MWVLTPLIFCLNKYMRRPADGLARGVIHIAEASASMAKREPVYSDWHLVVTRTQVPEGLRFSGEIDIGNSSAVAQSLRLAFPDAGSPHLDLSRLTFCDVSGIRAIVECADSLGEGRHLLIHGLPDQLAQVVRAVGWADRASIVLCDCGVVAA